MTCLLNLLLLLNVFNNNVYFHNGNVKPTHKEIAQQSVNPLQYGADPTGKNSSTAAFNKAVDYAIKNSISSITLTSGTYFIGSSGVDKSNRPYGVDISNARGLKIVGLGDVNIVIDIANPPTPINAFRIFNSTNVSVSNITFRAAGNTRADRGALYTGAGVYAEGCNTVEIGNCKFQNTFYAVCSFRSTLLNIHDNLFINGNYSSYNCMPKSAILLFSSSDTKVINNVIYGSLVDGDLSLFGLHTDNCLISGNKLYGYAYEDPSKLIKRLAQGITIDQGPKNNIIKDNLVYGYFYGIDIKAATFNNVISGNTLQYCKVGISERRGEANKVSYSFNNRVTQNKIIMGGNWVNNYKFYGIYESVGILSEDRADFHCSNNVIEVNKASLQRGAMAGIAVKQNINGDDKDAFDMNIQGNSINFNSDNADGTPSVNSDGIFLANIKKQANISDNTIQSTGNKFQNISNIFKISGSNSAINMNGNKIPGLNDRSKIFKMMGASKVGSFKMKNNSDDAGVWDKIQLPAN